MVFSFCIHISCQAGFPMEYVCGICLWNKKYYFILFLFVVSLDLVPYYFGLIVCILNQNWARLYLWQLLCPLISAVTQIQIYLGGGGVKIPIYKLLFVVKGLFYSHISAVKILDWQLSSKYFKICIEICHATYWVVKNLSQPLEFWANSGCFWRLSPQDDVRIIFNHPDYLNYFRMHNLPESCVQVGRIIFELGKKM